MAFTIVKGGGDCDDAEFAVIDDDGASRGCHATEEEAQAQANALNTADDSEGEAAATSTEADVALLPETFAGPVARSVDTGEAPQNRNFANTVWTWRDVNESRLPVMWQTENAPAHATAKLAGYITELSMDGDSPFARGRWFDNEAGREMRDVVKAAGRWGVSVDPGKVEWEDECTAEDDEGFCTAMTTHFLAYQIIGFTGTPFPGFEDAWIEIEEAEAVTASAFPPLVASALAHPPLGWFTDPEFSGPTPLTITDEGQVFAHVATFDACHTGFGGFCQSPPDKIAMHLFHSGKVRTAEGNEVATGPLVMGTDHAAVDPSIRATGAVDHYAHTGLAWADVVLGVDEHGIWAAGACRPGINEDQLRVLRASSLSGDWRTLQGELQLCGVLTVNSPGFPIPMSLVASGKAYPHGESRVRLRGNEEGVLAVTGLGMVRCPECAKRARLARGDDDFETPPAPIDRIMAVLGNLVADVAVVKARTEVLNAQRRDQLAARIRG